MSSPGTVTQLWANAQGTVVRLGNFDLESERLKPEHIAHLRGHVVPVLGQGGSLRLIGLAGRSGNAHYNEALGHRRAHTVVEFLRGTAGPTFAVTREESLGERAAALAGVRDGVEHPNWRSVIVSYWNHPVPPPPIEVVETAIRYVDVFTQKNVPLPERATGHEDGAFGNFLAQSIMQYRAPEVGVECLGSIRVPDTYTIHQIRRTRQDISNGPGLLIALGERESQPQQVVLRFHWGPAATDALLWNRQTFDRHLTNAQALRIYHHPGAFAVAGLNID